MPGATQAISLPSARRDILLGHHSGRITTHYSAAELSRLPAATNKACERDGTHAELVGAAALDAAEVMQNACKRSGEQLRGTAKFLKSTVSPVGIEPTTT